MERTWTVKQKGIKMYKQKTIIANSPDELDKEINKLYDQDYLFTGPPICIKNGTKYVQTVVKVISTNKY